MAGKLTRTRTSDLSDVGHGLPYGARKKTGTATSSNRASDANGTVRSEGKEATGHSRFDKSLLGEKKTPKVNVDEEGKFTGYTESEDVMTTKASSAHLETMRQKELKQKRRGK